MSYPYYLIYEYLTSELLNIRVIKKLVEVWFNANKLSLNYSKTKYLLIKLKT